MGGGGGGGWLDRPGYFKRFKKISDGVRVF